MNTRQLTGPVAIAFAALAATSVAHAMTGSASPAGVAAAVTSDQLRPSPAAMLQIDELRPRATTNMRPAPRWGEVWPEITFVEVQA